MQVKTILSADLFYLKIITVEICKVKYPTQLFPMIEDSPGSQLKQSYLTDIEVDKLPKGRDQDVTQVPISILMIPLC